MMVVGDALGVGVRSLHSVAPASWLWILYMDRTLHD
jgi:hypothetical protein